MTILNDFAQTAEEVAQHLGSYYGTRDSNELTGAIEKLQDQIAAFQREAADPALQETQVTLTRLSGAAVLENFRRDNALCLSNADYTADGPIIEGKLLRVHPCSDPVSTSDDPFSNGGICLTKVTLCSSTCLILAPVVAS